ncbi:MULTISPECIES: lactonase family protein [unclassified Actinopolyspora]|uniref:lactonase family protein n=1 Tax=unclassified Actinopolyspora TaxID=2639451 RepID=UPI0013F5CA1A|nr:MULTISPECIES: lactonase family protein [unclassified Actinopolyspora]NHD16825.1 lactonase family protein [Actinopolyspora sp. BKK2]NHE75977.1 lactonase family protein [Actinopolyspora sp. BKK1]
MSTTPNRRAFLTALGAVGATTALTGTSSARPAGHRSPVYLGSFSWTDPPGEGFQVFARDISSGALRPESTIDGVPDASWLAFSPRRRVLYTTNELAPNGAITALDLDDPWQPRILNTRSSEGASPTHLSVHPTGRFLLTANYTDGTVVVHRLNDDGGVGEPTDLAEHSSGHRAPKAHQVLPDPTGRWTISVDLGADAVHTYHLDTVTGKLRLNQRLPIRAGNGPRHLEFHPAGRYAYLVNELASTVTVLEWHATAGEFAVLSTLDTRPPGARGENVPAEIVVDRAGRFCYLTNRGDDTVAVFTIEARGARLRLSETVPTGGAWPRHCTLDRSQRWLYVANQNSGTVTRLPRHPGTGRVGPVAGSVAAPGAVMLALRN